MAIFKFYQIYRSIKEVVGEEMAHRLFPEYSTLPDKMPPNEQAQLGKLVMDRLDAMLDKETVIKIRQCHTCNPSIEQLAKIIELKQKSDNIDEIIREYSEFLSPGSVRRDGDLLYVSFGLDKCVCGMFRKLETYEPMSTSWCECCNGHVIKMYSMICDRNVKSEILDAVACGGSDCVFKVQI
ncbi:MAG: hypothetical protein K0S61_4900 [Anaerocolumna sp.]|jgi:hypothetical protein|nr:hypothetical protein [Anaerocolumna sp.]